MKNREIEIRILLAGAIVKKLFYKGLITKEELVRIEQKISQVS